MTANASVALLDCVKQVYDARLKRSQRHVLSDIIMITVCAVISGATSWEQVQAFGVGKQDWLKKFLLLPNGIPSHDTFYRTFSRLKPEYLQPALQKWLQSLNADIEHPHYAIDGKSLRGTARKISPHPALHLVSVWAAERQLSLGQIAVEEKSNEITAIPKILETLHLQGAIVTIDAMGCQKKTLNKSSAVAVTTFSR